MLCNTWFATSKQPAVVLACLPACRLAFLDLSNNPIGGQLPELPDASSLQPASAEAAGAAAAGQVPASAGEHSAANPDTLSGQAGAALPAKDLAVLMPNCSLGGPLPPSWAGIPKLARLSALDLGRQVLAGHICIHVTPFPASSIVSVVLCQAARATACVLLASPACRPCIGI